MTPADRVGRFERDRSGLAWVHLPMAATWLDWLITAVEEAVDAVFPPACHLCGAAVDGGWACEAHRLPGRPPGHRCGRCAAGLPRGFADGFPCADCRRNPPRFGRLVALADYRQSAAVREWILAFKHGGRSRLDRPLACALAERLAGAVWLPPDASFVPVPLHPLRHLERGYDQAARLAGELGQALERPVVPALWRVRPTRPQGSAGAPSRRANVSGAFELASGLRPRVDGRPLWLVDDVVTSGATVDACASLLRRAGARSVDVVALARADRADAGRPW